MPPWVLATRNAGKLRELRALCATHSISVIDLREAGVSEDPAAEEAVESYDTFEENALAKARYFSSRLPGRVIVADDSGLEVVALAGAPGVRSKRWSGHHGDVGAVDAANNTLLLARVASVAIRDARFVCAAAWSDGTSEVVVRGDVAGRIVDAPRGANGFGYDPHFFVNELGMTMGEASVAEKEGVSHRGRAFARLFDVLRGRALLRDA